MSQHFTLEKDKILEYCLVQVGSRPICHVDEQDSADQLQERIRSQHQLEFVKCLLFFTLLKIQIHLSEDIDTLPNTKNEKAGKKILRNLRVQLAQTKVTSKLYKKEHF